MPIDTIAHSHDLGDKGVACQRPIHGLEQQQCNASIRSLGSMQESNQATKKRGYIGAVAWQACRTIHQGNGHMDDFFIMSIGFFLL